MLGLGIPRRHRGGRPKVNVTREQLEALYQTKTMAQIAEQLGCGETTIWGKVRAWKIVHKQYGAHGYRRRPREFSAEHREKLSAAHLARGARGDKNPRWLGGATLKNYAVRLSPEHQQWKKAALKRAGGKCEVCGVRRGEVCLCCGTKVALHVHHIRPFAKYPELRFDPNNAEVVCPKCHGSRHK